MELWDSFVFVQTMPFVFTFILSRLMTTEDAIPACLTLTFGFHFFLVKRTFSLTFPFLLKVKGWISKKAVL